jgi:excisionase family DNA binding protein
MEKYTPRFLNRQDASAQLGISLSSLQRRISDGTIPAVKLGRRVLIPVAVLSELIDKASILVKVGGAK